MPLYTYIVSYKGATYVAQGSHSNHQGFISSWCSNIPAGALPALTPALQKELATKAYRSEFLPVSNVRHAWRKAIDIGGSECTVVAVQTQRP
jgi:hypothetical protein